MTLADAVRSALTQYVTFRGRAPRSEYWWFYLFTLLVGVVTSIVDNALGVDVVGTVVSLALLLPTIAVTVRRLHDTDRSAWWLLATILPIVVGTVAVVSGFVMALGGQEGPGGLLAVGVLLVLVGAVVNIVLMCLRGTPGPNRFGPPPLGPSPVGPHPGSQDGHTYGGGPTGPYGQQPYGQPGPTQPFPQHPTAPPPPSGPERSGETGRTE